MKKILFVCTANIARSPMAEALFNKKIRDLGLTDRFRARSAGTWARDGQPAATDGQRVMKSRGLDTSPHRSRVITREIIDDADLVLTMEAGQKEALRVEFPHKKRQIYMLTEMVGPGYDIGDPFGRFLDDFEATASELERILDQGMKTMLQLALRKSE